MWGAWVPQSPGARGWGPGEVKQQPFVVRSDGRQAQIFYEASYLVGVDFVSVYSAHQLRSPFDDRHAIYEDPPEPPTDSATGQPHDRANEGISTPPDAGRR